MHALPSTRTDALCSPSTALLAHTHPPQVGESFWLPASQHISQCEAQLLAASSVNDHSTLSNLSQILQAHEVALALGQERWLQLSPELLVAARQAMATQADAMAANSKVGRGWQDCA